MLLTKQVSVDAKAINLYIKNNWPKVKKMVIVAIISGLAAVLQSCGGFLPGVGYLISPFTTIPIMLCTLVSLSSGLLGYFLTIILLVVFMPSEIMAFPFTTGILGIGLGVGFLYLQRRIYIVISTSSILLIGISTLLYAIHFPVLGPAASSAFSLKTLMFIYIFCLIYCFIWTEFSVRLIKRLKKIICG